MQTLGKPELSETGRSGRSRDRPVYRESTCTLTSRRLPCTLTSRRLPCTLTSRRLSCTLTSRRLPCTLTSPFISYASFPRPLSDEQELSPGRDLVHADQPAPFGRTRCTLTSRRLPYTLTSLPAKLPSASCRADPVSARGF
ncbi:hypothetical protein DPMN_160950 [Dreissena polymorpha]|uniref:Uncharacterized protein n=1 Tax=Dreissena polymorpha TaxID=45954 RepID=A0A9D4ENU0_DREPO|nr:hypothetical protein DPMN_160950 [Dreissena polymorpha]